MIGGMISEFPYKDFSEAIDALDRETDDEAKLWHQRGLRVSVWTILGRMIRDFWKTYEGQKSRRMGVRGLFWAVHCGMRPFLTYAKCWEHQRNKSA